MEAPSPKFARRPSERPAPPAPRAATHSGSAAAASSANPAATPSPPPTLPAYAKPPARVSQPGEGIEREAEAHANAVAPTAAPDPTPTSAPPATPPSVSPSSSPEDGTAAPATATPSPSELLPAYAASRVAERRGRGEPLPDDARAPLEGHFGRDFADVRLHTDGEAARLTTALGARAFTSGRDI